MGIPRLFKLPSHKRFNYKPLYYDPVKEEREQRKRELAKELGLKEVGGYVPTIKHGSIRSYSKRLSKRSDRTSNIRLIIIVVVLLFLAYLILYR